MQGKDIYACLNAGIIDGDRSALVITVNDALNQGIAPLQIVQKGLQPAMEQVGEMFKRYEVYLPEMMMAAAAWEEAMKVLEPRLIAGGDSRQRLARVVLGTVKGDIHSLGKNIVAILLRANGFEVYDLGIDVPASGFIDKAEEMGAEVIGLSALMTTTMPQQKSVIEHLKARGLREKYYVIVGGGCTNQSWADEIQADAYGITAADAVDLIKRATKKEVA